MCSALGKSAATSVVSRRRGSIYTLTSVSGGRSFIDALLSPRSVVGTQYDVEAVSCLRSLPQPDFKNLQNA